TLTGGGDLPGSARAWIEGPVRWLVLPDEERRFRRLESSAEVLAFIESFWARRDPDPDTPGNPFVQQFFERVQEADLLYAGEGRPGSLTDRGRAYILLGSPSVLRYTQLSAPAWDPDGRPRSPTEQLRLEVWGYEREALPERLVARLDEEGFELPVEVRFLEERRSTRLIDGEDLLEEAARAAVREGA
ncbi:MAG: GWxTD domain-containing protein, partial [Acidobacteriota bacterium]